MNRAQEDAAYYAVITAPVRYDPELSSTAKLLYGEITSLCRAKGYCWATNSHFAELYSVSESTVSRLIAQLEKRGHIRVETVAIKTGSERRIYTDVYYVERVEDTAPEGGTQKEQPPSGGCAKTAKGGAQKDQGGVRKNRKQNDYQVNDLSEKEPPWAKFAQAMNYIATVCPFDIIRAAGSTVEDIISDAIGHGYQIIYVDYVQLLRAPGVREVDGYSRITVVSQALKTFAQNTNTAVVALAQLTRPPGTESRRKDEKEPEMPTMHSLKGSGQLEQDADAVFLVFPFDRKDNKSARVFRIAKNKDGDRPAPVLLEFDGSTQTMVETGSDGISMDDWMEMDQVEMEWPAGGEENNPFV